MLHLFEYVIVRADSQRIPPEFLEAAADEPVAEGDARKRRAKRQSGKRDQHDQRRFMDRMIIVMAVVVMRVVVVRLSRQRARPVAPMAEEGHEDEPPGIEGSEGGGDVDAPERVVRAETMRGEGGLDDRVLRHVAGKAERGERNADAGQRQRADDHHPEGDGNLGPKSAHPSHVLLVMHRGDDRARAEEQKRLEEGVGEEMEHAEAIAADAKADEHVAELRTGRIGDDALDVVLHQTDGGGEKGRGRADDENGAERGRRHLEQRRQARDHKDASRHHGRRMDERGDGRRALHRVREPGVEQELGRFAHRAHEEQQARKRHRVPVEADEVNSLAGEPGRSGKHLIVCDRSRQLKGEEDAEREAEVAHTVDDKGLDGCGVGRGALVPEADQQVGHEADALPAEEQLDEIVGRHQHQHGEGEEREIGEEPRNRRVIRHVADRIDVHEKRHRRHDDEHHGGQGVDPERPSDGKLAGGEPVGDRHVRISAACDLEEGDPGEDEANAEKTGGHIFGAARADPSPENAGDQETEERQKDDQIVHEVRLSPSAN